MDRINIANLFPSAANNNSINNTPLDVRSLYKLNSKKNYANKTEIKEPDFNLNKLINKKHDRQKRTYIEYKKIFNMILNKITMADKLNNTSVIYEVTMSVFSCPEYSSIDCLRYAEDRLRKMHMDTYKLSDKSIFVSWKNIEENKADAEAAVVVEATFV
jgi:hypothetical protein